MSSSRRLLSLNQVALYGSEWTGSRVSLSKVRTRIASFRAGRTWEHHAATVWRANEREL